ncbi:tRNA pseudouridine synthase A, putative [Leishmania tarentolae]|uniref:tRNA pseudouridine synthase A, putative n=1 Tax=Leishmania tarentolae TaxID=5689 RepID=A0A640KVS2_LEITA|nr:tRNA pseudouridine synthase A, putative [Leishmania tarentolae]
MGVPEDTDDLSPCSFPLVAALAAPAPFFVLSASSLDVLHEVTLSPFFFADVAYSSLCTLLPLPHCVLSTTSVSLLISLIMCGLRNIRWRRRCTAFFFFRPRFCSYGAWTPIHSRTLLFPDGESDFFAFVLHVSVCSLSFHSDTGCERMRSSLLSALLPRQVSRCCLADRTLSWLHFGGAVSTRWCATQRVEPPLPSCTARTASTGDDATDGQGSSSSIASEPHRSFSSQKSRRERRRGSHGRLREERHPPRRRATRCSPSSPQPEALPDADATPVPHSRDISAAEDMVDVEKYFPRAVAHLKAVPASAEAAEESRARRWHETTHEMNADGIVTPTKRAERERRESGVWSFFDEGGLDVRGGMADKLKSGAYGSARDPVERDSPDILKLTGGNARRHGGLHLATESNAAPADQTIEGDRGDAGAYREFGDTPVQLTDMLRERLMELKAGKLREERSETFLPQRLHHRVAGELLMLAQQGETARPEVIGRAAALQAAPAPLQHKAAQRRSGATATTLADLVPEEEEKAALLGDATRDGAHHGTSDRAILHDGVSLAQVANAMQVASGTDDSVPGASPHDPLRRLAAIAANTGRRASVFRTGDDANISAEEVERAGFVHLLRTLPRAGFCSRREAAAIIASGQVRVNNVTERNPFRLVQAQDDIHVAGHQSRLRFAPPRLWMYHKPANVIVSRNDTAGRTLITKHARILGMDHLIPVGSLPMRAHGILLLTNDGELSRFLENPKTMVQRTYLLRVRPAFDPILVHKLNTEGIQINGRLHRNAEFFVNPATKSRYSVKVKVRGESMPIAHLMQHLGRTVERGGRISFGPFALSNLAVGSVREVTIPPFYSQHMGAIWQPFIERDWPYFRRQRVSRLRKLCRHRELTPKELEELDNYTYEEVKDALNFESSELQTLAEQRAHQLRRASHLGDDMLPLPDDFPKESCRRSAVDVAVDDAAAPFAEADGEEDDDAIVEDITSVY